jgi:murein DD-endopeptidase MepM/ murein hydrolase activator NlpD
MKDARLRAATGALLLLLPGSCLTPANFVTKQASLAVAATPQPDSGTRADAFILKRAPRQGLVTLARAPAGTAAVTLDGVDLPLADDGYFLLASDRDAPASAILRAERGRDPPIEAVLTIAPGQWRIERINAPYRGSAAGTADFARRRPAELDQINAARRQHVASDGWRQDFIWPVRGRLSGFFGSQRIYQGKPGSYHSGLDIAAPTGTPFVAPADGTVVLAAAAPFTLEGHLLIVDHGMGLTSAFLHAARLDVTVGQVVRQGQLLGAVGATGRATGPHLHWGMRWRTARLDPLPLLPR